MLKNIRMRRLPIGFLLGIFVFSCSSAEQKAIRCSDANTEHVKHIGESLRFNSATDLYQLDRSVSIESSFSDRFLLVAGELPFLKREGLDISFTYGVWLVELRDEAKDRIFSLSGNSRSYSSMPEADISLVNKVFESNDIMLVRDCLRSYN